MLKHKFLPFFTLFLIQFALTLARAISGVEPVVGSFRDKFSIESNPLTVPKSNWLAAKEIYKDPGLQRFDQARRRGSASSSFSSFSDTDPDAPWSPSSSSSSPSSPYSPYLSTAKVPERVEEGSDEGADSIEPDVSSPSVDTTLTAEPKLSPPSTSTPSKGDKWRLLWQKAKTKLRLPIESDGSSPVVDSSSSSAVTSSSSTTQSKLSSPSSTNNNLNSKSDKWRLLWEKTKYRLRHPDLNSISKIQRVTTMDGKKSMYLPSLTVDPKTGIHHDMKEKIDNMLKEIGLSSDQVFTTSSNQGSSNDGPKKTFLSNSLSSDSDSSVKHNSLHNDKIVKAYNDLLDIAAQKKEKADKVRQIRNKKVAKAFGANPAELVQLDQRLQQKNQQQREIQKASLVQNLSPWIQTKQNQVGSFSIPSSASSSYSSLSSLDTPRGGNEQKKNFQIPTKDDSIHSSTVPVAPLRKTVRFAPIEQHNPSFSQPWQTQPQGIRVQKR